MMRIVARVSAVCSFLALGASAQNANFDTFPEGPITATFVDNGITFSNLVNGVSGGPGFVIEDASGALAGMPGFTTPMTLGASGLQFGPGVSYGRIISFDMSPAQVSTEARLELFELPIHPGNTIHLQALMNGSVVNSASLTVPNGAAQHHTLSIAGVPFDQLHLKGDGVDFGAFYALIDNVHIGAPPAGAVSCAGDGSGTACPCGNTSSIGAGAGCLSSLGVGATLRATDVASLANDSLVLHASQMPATPCVFFQGTTHQSGGAGAVFGDGLRCAGGIVVRLATKANQTGFSQLPEIGDASLSTLGQVSAPGLRVYQAWFHDTATFCTSDAFNLTNSVAITWAP